MKQKILKALKQGRENAITRKQLVKLTGYNDRAVRNIIADLRAEGVPVVSNTKTGGYYLPTTLEEANEYYNSMRSRAIKTFLSARATKQWIREHGQEQLDLK